ncbi:hypothetical protein [Paracoccus marinaquae]|uniref:hypothetical protein n=1 Tax=Paracoccus marinaquae TaxID=2841926 RepID=UPI00209025E0|nr:hypothetical protein [Paracoccus marinaquae]
MLTRLAETAADLSLPFEAIDLPRLGAEANVIISITSAFSPLVMHEHVKGPTHIAAVGTDTPAEPRKLHHHQLGPHYTTPCLFRLDRGIESHGCIAWSISYRSRFPGASKPAGSHTR